MRPTLIIAAAICGITLSTTANAHPGIPGHRHTAAAPAPHVVGTHKHRIFRPGARCAVEGCEGSVTSTGPQGNTVTKSGSAYCLDGTCESSRSVTGPNGETRTLERSISR
ncbi:MAG: hypothetical protein AAFR73_00845 [Pseudomonadota bacterium]